MWEDIYQKCLGKGKIEDFDPNKITSLGKEYHRSVYGLILYCAQKHNIDIRGIPFSGVSGKSGLGILFNFDRIPDMYHDELKLLLTGYLNL